ncbi:MAG: tetratricopeptide repeat protein [Succinivibrionaceae bacterium]|nr:tetratricopeptide repeat protein [Succinivibrionaceae bacterium]
MLVEINEQNIKTEIIEKSQTGSVIVYIFHSQATDQVELKNKINAYIGSADLSFACVDIANDALQAVAYQFQLNALPALAVVKESRVVGILQGDEIVPNYENLLNDYIPQEDQLLADEAAKLLQEQKTDEALSKINKALQLKNQTRYRLIKADIFIKQNKLDDAEAIINACSMEDQLNDKDYYSNLKSALELAKKAMDNSPVEELKKKLAEDPDNLDLKIEIAVQYNQLNNKVEALNYLFEVLKKDINYKDAKQTFLDIIATMGASAEASSFRRKLYSLMY